MFPVDFDNPAPQLLSHPDYQKHESFLYEKLNPFFLRDHFILFSSGTSGGDLKGYALSKKALFANASAVNSHFKLTPEDVWGLSLPVYHVGGLSVLARAHLLKNKVVDLRKWDPHSWIQKMQEVTITTLVPTQLYDLVKLKMKAPAKLRYVVIGGDFLSDALKEKAMELGWPVIRTFGMSEVSSQLASTLSPESDDLEILPIHQTKIQDERLLIKSSALFTLEFTMGERFRVSTARELCDKEGFYYTKDRAEIQGKIIRPLGRMGDELKVSGHLVDFNLLKNNLSRFLLEKNLYGQVEIQVIPDERKGQKLVLMFLKAAEEKLSREDIAKLFSPVKIDEWQSVENFERTALGKLKKT